MTDKDKTIRVLVVDGVYPPAYTGAGLRAHRTYKRLANKFPVEFSVLTTNSGGLSAGVDEYDGIQIYRTKANKSLLSQLLQVYSFFKKYDLRRFDIVHGFGGSLVVYAAGLWAKFHSMKLIYEITVFSTNNKRTLIRKIKDALNFFRFGYAGKIIYKKADLFIAINESIRKHYKQQCIPDSKIWLRPNPVDTTKYYLPDESERRTIRKDINIPENKIVILLVGKFEPRKNQKFALEVIRSLPDDYYLLMVGPADDSVTWYFDDINTTMGTNGIHKKVGLYTGYRTDIEMFYRASDILWIPSKSEGTPNVMLEGLCCGIPVLANSDLALHDYIVDSKNGYHAVLNVEDFRKKTLLLQKLSKNSTVRSTIAESAANNYRAEMIDQKFITHLQLLQDNN